MRLLPESDLKALWRQLILEKSPLWFDCEIMLHGRGVTLREIKKKSLFGFIIISLSRIVCCNFFFFWHLRLCKSHTWLLLYFIHSEKMKDRIYFSTGIGMKHYKNYFFRCSNDSDNPKPTSGAAMFS